MTENWELFLKDPRQAFLPNDGVTQVVTPSTEAQWRVLRYELESFVCQGEYERGLERILSAYLTNLQKPQQQMVWVSGFYGSGKSHFVRVLEYLWRDYIFPDGVSARGLAHIPDDLRALLTELTTQGRREGGLWSAAGKLSDAATNSSVRLAILGILFRGAELPEQYPAARLALWLRQNGAYAAVAEAIEAQGRSLARELRNMYVSPVLAQSLLAAMPDLAADRAGVLDRIRTQFPSTADISDEQFYDAVQDVLNLQSAAPGKLPCTLLVLDEVQQYIGDNQQRTLQVQQVVEDCAARFGSRLLFVATGQAALQANPQLTRLQGRFTVRVTLSDTDVEKVIREVALQKRPDRVAELERVLTSASGEIDRQLGGTRIAPAVADRADLVPDYPLLPARRRFWERLLRGVDSGGKDGQLRTQLKIVVETSRSVAGRSVGTVVPGDAIYGSLKDGMLGNDVLLREVAELIERQSEDGTADGALRSRLCAAVFLIGKLPADGPLAAGVRATPVILADLLAEDLVGGSDALRQRIPPLLQRLADEGVLMAVDDEYRLQTREGAAWEADFKQSVARLQADDVRIASDRNEALAKAVGALLRGVTLTQGLARTARRYELHFGAAAPEPGGATVPVWVRDDWSASEKTVREDAQAAGLESPVVFVYLPRREPDALRRVLAEAAAARDCLERRPPAASPEDPEVKPARESMQFRLEGAAAKLETLVAGILGGARVYQGGGNELAEGGLKESLRAALDGSLARLFPKLALADSPHWKAVIDRAIQGSGDALGALDYHGDVERHPACREVRAFFGSAGSAGSAGGGRARRSGAERYAAPSPARPTAGRRTPWTAPCWCWWPRTW